MATFPNFTPIYGSSKTINTKAVVVNLGDGYQHRTLFGLPQNQSPMTLDLTFSVSESESDTIFSFLNDTPLTELVPFSIFPPNSLNNGLLYILSEFI